MTPALTNTPVLETDRLSLRTPQGGDWPLFRTFVTSPRSRFVRPEEIDDAKAARTHAFHDLGWTTAVSYIHPDNARSITLAERLGATLDPKAQTPDSDPCLVYRHPRQELSQ